MEPAEFRNKFIKHYNDEELKNLCFDLSVDYESLPAQGKAGKARELLWFLANEDKLEKLVENLQQERPFIGWPKSQNEIAYITDRLQREAKEDQWQRRAPLIISSLSIVGIGIIIWLLIPKGNVSLQIPDKDKFKSVGLKTISITSMSLEQNGTLWVIGESIQDGWGLYSLDTSATQDYKLQEINHDSIDKQANILDLLVDCVGNVWLLQENIGPLVITEHGKVVFIADLPEWPAQWRTAYSIDGYCDKSSGLMYVWLGRDGIISIQYSIEGDFSFDTNQLIKRTSQSFNDIVDIHYDVDDDTIWVLSNFGQILGISFANVQDPVKIDLEEPTFSLFEDKEDTLWVGANNKLAYGQETLTILSPENNEHSFGQITAVYATDSWVWVGGQCNEANPQCNALSVVTANTIQPIKFRPTAVNTIVVDRQGVAWIGTNEGLVYYPPDN